MINGSQIPEYAHIGCQIERAVATEFRAVAEAQHRTVSQQIRKLILDEIARVRAEEAA